MSTSRAFRTQEWKAIVGCSADGRLREWRLEPRPAGVGADDYRLVEAALHVYASALTSSIMVNRWLRRATSTICGATPFCPASPSDRVLGIGAATRKRARHAGDGSANLA